MQISYSWLRELVELPYTPSELADVLTRQGMAVDALDHVGAPYERVVVGKLLEVVRHPQADALSICKVDVGAEILQIVCGAPGIQAGQHVPVALIGARLGDTVIKKTKLRGVESFGMCCAADELGISSDHSTLLFLDTALAPGTPLEQIVAGEDYIYELDISSNRPDLLSHVGVAREIAAHLEIIKQQKGWTSPAPPALEEDDENAERHVTIRILDPDLCPRYTARVIRDVTIAPSPPRLQARLHRLGIRPISNVVDATNYALLEYGQPLHAFDFERVAQGAIVVRRAAADERFRTLDDIERRLDAEMLLIADPDKAIALAGVMGGANSEVTAVTRTVLLESASFHGPSVRRTAKLLGLQSEASYRFERGVRGTLVHASARAAQLMVQYAGGRCLRGIVDADHSTPPQAFTCRFSRCISLLGLQIPADTAHNALHALGFTVDVDANDSDHWHVTPPEHRVDCTEGPDIAEDLARLIGYDAVPTDTTVQFHATSVPASVIDWREEVRDLFVGAGVLEAINPSLISRELLTAAGLPADAPEMQVVALANAITQEQSILRTALYPGLIRNIQHNCAFGAAGVRLFELGKIYRPAITADGFVECERLGLALWGAATEKGVWDAERECDFADGIALLELLFEKLGVTATRSATTRPGFHPGRTARLALADGTELGFIGELDPRTLRDVDIRGRVVLAEVAVEPLCAATRLQRSYQPLPRFPMATRDVAFIVPEAVTHQHVCDIVRAAGVAFLDHLELFDVYRGEHVAAGSKSMAYRIAYRMQDRTLTDEEIDAAHGTVKLALTDKLGARLRA